MKKSWPVYARVKRAKQQTELGYAKKLAKDLDSAFKIAIDECPVLAEQAEKICAGRNGTAEEWYVLFVLPEE